MAFLDSFAKLPLPLGKFNRFPKDSVNCTTADYLKFKVVCSREIMPNEKFTCNASQYVRLTPMLKPAFANAKFENRAFFVPYRTIFKDFNAFKANSQSSTGIILENVGNVNAALLLSSLFMDGFRRWLDPLSPNTSADDIKAGRYDIAVPIDPNPTGSSATVFFFNLTPQGKQLIDILINTGYNFCYRPLWNDIAFSAPEQRTWYGYSIWSTTMSLDSAYWRNMTELVVSSLPLAAALKVYYDYYLSGRGNRTKFGLYIEDVIDRIASFSVQQWLEHRDFNQYFPACYQFFECVYYDDDYFIVNTPTYMDTYGTATSITLSDQSYRGNLSSVVTSNPVSPSAGTTTPRITGNSAGSAVSQPYNLTQYVLESLSALTKWMRRNNIAGFRTLDRYLAHYGVELPAEKLNRSVYLGKFDVDVTIDAIFQQAPADGQPLGDYAGIGIGGNKGTFKYSNGDEFGQFLVISICKPDVAYYQGIKREMLHIKPFDFFTGEFDGLGYQATCAAELSTSAPTSLTQDGLTALTAYLPTNPNSVFGFVPRYAEYKCCPCDVLSGDFRIYSAGLSSYDFFHQFRSIGVGNINSSFIIDEEFRTAADRGQYDRIFAAQSNIYDHFICFYSFKVMSSQPSSKMFDSLDFVDEIHNHPTRDVRVGGTKF